MKISRRDFVAAAALSGAAAMGSTEASPKAERGRLASPEKRASSPAADRFDPWIELDPAAFRLNVRDIARITKGTPILAVVKCNGYGLGHQFVGPILDEFPEVAGFAVVMAEEAIELRDAGVRKPILLMDDFAESMAEDLALRDITLAAYTPGVSKRFTALAGKVGRPIKVHPYLDTGFHRMGIDFRKAEPLIEDLADNTAVNITGIMTEFTEVVDFDREQIARFRRFTDKMQKKGIKLGQRHAAASHGLTHHSDANFDMVRPGNMVYGILPDDLSEEGANLKVAYRLKARVINIVRVHKGESTGYGRFYVADRDTDVAIVKCGRTDGYIYRKGGAGTHVLIHSKPYPVIAGVSGSHCFVGLGLKHGVKLRDVATMIGPEPGIRPHELAEKQGLGRYEGFNLSARLPKYVIS